LLIIFDLDDTLVDTSGSITSVKLERALQRVCQAGLNLNLKLPDPLKELLNINLESFSANEALETFFTRFDLPREPFLTLAKETVYKSKLQGIRVLSTPGAVETLQELCLEHRLALVTIGDEGQQREKLKKAGIDTGFFSIIEVVEEIKKSAYQKIVSSLSVSPEEVLVVGDRAAKDLVPAKELGCQTVLMRFGRGLLRQDLAAVDFQIELLKELGPIIKGEH
jgi:putative hydrolase of the HAD superfamily